MEDLVNVWTRNFRTAELAECMQSVTRSVDRVELRGFGAFSVKHRESRVGRNPRTGEAVQVGAKRVPYFKTGKQLREKLNG